MTINASKVDEYYSQAAREYLDENMEEFVHELLYKENEKLREQMKYYKGCSQVWFVSCLTVVIISMLLLMTQ